MNREELIAKANEGDVGAMMQLVEMYIDEKDWNEATDWADKAAETGDVNAMYKAVNLHSMRMHSLVALGMLDGLMPKDAQAVQENAAVLIGACRKGLVDLNEDIYSHLLSTLRDGIYYEAISCYYSEPSDYARIIHLLQSVDSAREQFLCGCAFFDTKRYDEALKKLNEAYQDGEYINAEKKTPEEGVFANAMHVFSDMERINGDLDKAVMILNRAIEGVSDEEMKARLRIELGKYQKKMFGGWKYMG